MCTDMQSEVLTLQGCPRSPIEQLPYQVFYQNFSPFLPIPMLGRAIMVVFLPAGNAQ